MGITKKQLMDSVGLIKKYVDEAVSGNSASDSMLQYALGREHVFTCTVDTSVSGAIGSNFMGEHGFKIEGQDDLPIVSNYQFIMVTLEVSRTCAERNDDNKIIVTHNVGTKIIPVSAIFGNTYAGDQSTLNVYPQFMSVDVVDYENMSSGCYNRPETVNITFILKDGSIYIDDYTVSIHTTNVHSTGLIIKLDVYYCFWDYSHEVSFDEEVGTEQVEAGSVGEPSYPA